MTNELNKLPIIKIGKACRRCGTLYDEIEGQVRYCEICNKKKVRSVF